MKGQTQEGRNKVDAALANAETRWAAMMMQNTDIHHDSDSDESHDVPEWRKNRPRRRPTAPSWWTDGKVNTQQHMIAAQQLGAKKR